MLQSALWIFSAALFLFLLISPDLLFFSPRGARLKQVRDQGKLVVAIESGPVTMYPGPNGQMQGFEYDLMKEFANELGVEVEFIAAGNITELAQLVNSGKADIAASSIIVSPQRRNLFRFSNIYQKSAYQAVYLRGLDRPKKESQLENFSVEITGDSSALWILQQLKKKHPDLEWTESESFSYEEILTEVWQGLVDVAIAPSNYVEVMRQYYPELHVAFTFKQPANLAWGFALNVNDESLIRRANRFIEKQKKSGFLATLENRYYGAASRAQYINMAHFQGKMDTVLPIYRALFEKYGKKNNIDWRLLAAMAYQESQWNPDAISPTGVKGIMMLTQGTADLMGIKNREDMEDSIRGGAKYIRNLIKKIPEAVEEPDRTWMALAAYNVGLGHLLDARVITAKRDEDPNSWNYVENNLPLLSEEKWNKNTKHGYARGNESVQYVNRIRSFYEILVNRDRQQEKNKNKKDKLDLGDLPI